MSGAGKKNWSRGLCLVVVEIRDKALARCCLPLSLILFSLSWTWIDRLLPGLLWPVNCLTFSQYSPFPPSNTQSIRLQVGSKKMHYFYLSLFLWPVSLSSEFLWWSWFQLAYILSSLGWHLTIPISWVP